MRALTDPELLKVILLALGGALAWLWAKVAEAQRRHRACEIELAQMKERNTAHDVRIQALEKTCSALTRLLKKETHVG